jgi:hypothetical protein
MYVTGRLAAHPLGQRGEGRPPGRVQHHHLAVQQRSGRERQNG